jgi:CheY-like chemotaxis protein
MSVSGEEGIMRVLVVDDASSARMYVVAMLKRLGIDKIVTVEDGSKALTLLKRDKNFDMIILDWNMPVMDGIEALTVMNHQGNKIPVLMMSGRDSPADIERALQMGVSAYLQKPFTLDSLADKINFMIEDAIDEEAGSVVTALTQSKIEES